jgi:Fic family protein
MVSFDTIREVLNAAAVYAELHTFKPTSEKDFLRAQGMLMDRLVARPGKYRTQAVGIAKGEEVQHIAPTHERVPFLMRSLFGYVADG